MSDTIKEHPILFSGPMVKAIIDGRKSMTRRIIKPQPPATVTRAITIPCPADKGAGVVWCGPDHMDPLDGTEFGGSYRARHPRGWDCPYGRVGDRLWVRETTQKYMLPNFLTGEPTSAACGRYVADEEPVTEEQGFDVAWWYSREVCPAIHMPRWASRITLEITDVKVERLNDISEKEAEDEGARVRDIIYPDEPRSAYSYVEQFRLLWDSINGKTYSWQSNPWVWAISFRRLP